MTPAEANARARQRHAERIAQLRASRPVVAKPGTTLRNGAHGHPGASRPARPEPAPNDADSAAGVLADARAVGLVGLKPPADSPVMKDVRSAAEKREDEATAAMLDSMRALGLPGLKKRAGAPEPTDKESAAVKKIADKDSAADVLDLARAHGVGGLRRR